MLPTIETERLILRLPVQEDFDGGWAEFHADAACMRYLGGPVPRSTAWRNLAQVAGQWQLRGFGQFSLIEKQGGRWIGWVGPWAPEEWPAREVGWMLIRSAWGNGYATEAARACMNLVFGTLGWPAVAHMIHPDNIASQSVARRLGSRFIRDATLPPPMDAFGTIQMWGQSADDWRTGRTGPDQN